MTVRPLREQGRAPYAVPDYVGTIVGESTSREFRLAVAHETIHEQEIVAVDAEMRRPDGARPDQLRVWATVERIERLNPLFPAEAGHELAATRTDPFDTVLSLSREMVTAVCRIIGAEPLQGSTGKLDALRYPPRPASSAYRPPADAIARLISGELQGDARRALDVATLANRDDVSVQIDGHAIVTRHLAILAMTGAGKSWAARRVVEQLAARNYPIVIFDPHGDYTGLADVPDLRDRVSLYRAELPIFEEDGDDAARIIESLSTETMSAPQLDAFTVLFPTAKSILNADNLARPELAEALHRLTGNPSVRSYPLRRDLFALAYVADAIAALSRTKATFPSERTLLGKMGLDGILQRVEARQTGTYNALARQFRRAASALREMERLNRSRAGRAIPLPADRTALVGHGRISVISLAGYSDVLQATLYTLVARTLFRERVRGKLALPYLMVLEEAHTFVPGRADHAALVASIDVTKQIAQEGRKFGAGLVLISQRPSRLDETTLAQCNSFVIMRMVNPADQQFVRRVVETLGEQEARMLPDLDVGEAILSGQLVNFPVLARMKAPQSHGEREEKDAFAALDDAVRAMGRSG